jgi:hypothetical protein
MAVLAGIDFFTVEVLTWRGLVTYYILFFIHLESRRVRLAGITRHPYQAWMQQMARTPHPIRNIPAPLDSGSLQPVATMRVSRTNHLQLVALI